MPDVTSVSLALPTLTAPSFVVVREAGEYVGGRVPGAVRMPMDRLPSGIELDPTGPVLVLCARESQRRGGRSPDGRDSRLGPIRRGGGHRSTPNAVTPTRPDHQLHT